MIRMALEFGGSLPPMLMGAIMGGIIGLVVWLIMAAKAKGRSTVDALGPSPALKESIEVSLSPSQVLDKLRAAGNPQYLVEPESTPDAILLRRVTDSSSYGYAFLLKTVP